MKNRVTPLLAAMLLTCALAGISGCAEQRGWTPTIDTYGDPNVQHLNQDMADCQRLAAQASGFAPEDAAIGVGTGGLMGAASGAIIGAITGNPGAGAAIGAAAGGFSGGASQGIQGNAQYKSAFSTCLRNRGHRPIN